MRILWKGSIGFGLVNIPVQLYTATQESSLSFTTMDKRDKAAIKYRKVNEVTGKEVAAADIVKAYKVGNQAVILDKEDFEKAVPGKKDHIDITQFVLEKEIDSVYYEQPYYLEPEKSGYGPTPCCVMPYKKKARLLWAPSFFMTANGSVSLNHREMHWY